jgi:glutamyl-tRNA reductase
MYILCLGLNHTTAPLDLREKLALDEDVVRIALARLACGHVAMSFVELVLISTCNRIELYAASNQLVFTELEAFLSEISNIPANQFRPHLYRFKEMDAVRHLFEVAAGLDSLVIGEPQILGQVMRALELARRQNTAGSILNRLFQAAIHAGRRTRTETAISRNPASVSSLAASLSERVVHTISKAQIVILGAGEMAELAVEALRKRGARKILVINRTLERAHALAQHWDAQATTFEQIHAALDSADILISSTGAPHTLISPTMVNETMKRRVERPLVLIDIAVPRDIDPDVANIPQVKLYDIDNLNAQLEHSLAERMAEVPQVKNILDEELEQFGDCLKSLDMLPLIADLHQNAETIRQNELEKTLRRLPDLTETERSHIEALTQALVKKLLHAPTHRLRAEATSSQASEYAAVARGLFNLSNTSTAAD